MHELTALINERQQRARELRAAARRADHPKRAESYAAQAQRMEDARTALVLQQERQSTAYSEAVVEDRAVLDMLIALVDRIPAQIEKELERTDLFPNMRDWAFEKKRALEDTKWFLRGRGDYYDHDNDPRSSPPHLVFADSTDGTIELFEEDSEEETQAREEALIFDDGAITTRYRVVPESGSERMVYRPILDRDNVYKELPPGILEQVVKEAGGPQNLRWPREHADREAVRACL